MTSVLRFWISALFLMGKQILECPCQEQPLDQWLQNLIQNFRVAPGPSERGPIFSSTAGLIFVITVVPFPFNPAVEFLDSTGTSPTDPARLFASIPAKKFSPCL